MYHLWGKSAEKQKVHTEATIPDMDFIIKNGDMNSSDRH